MKQLDFREIMMSQEYDFLRNNERLGNRIILMGLGGSYAYGTNNENSDYTSTNNGVEQNKSAELLKDK